MERADLRQGSKGGKAVEAAKGPEPAGRACAGGRRARGSAPAEWKCEEVGRDRGVFGGHENKERASHAAEPQQHLPNAFRTARQRVHDSIVGGGYAAAIAKAKGLKKWATCSPDYAYGRDTTGEFVYYLKQFAPDVEIISDGWPKLFQPDYTDGVTKLFQT